MTHPLRRLLRYGVRYRTRIRLASICSVLNKFFDLAPEMLIGAAVDVVVNQQDSLVARFGVIDVRDQLIVLSVLTAITWSLESAFEYLYARLWRGLAQDVQHDLRLEAYGHLQALEPEFFEERSTGGLLSVLGDDVNQLERFLNTGANDMLQVATTVLLVGGAFFVLAPSVAWMAMLPMPFIILGSIRFQRQLAPRYAEVREAAGLVNARLAANLGGINTIKSFTAEAHELGRLEADSEVYRRSNAGAIRLSSAFVPLIRILILAGFTATLLFGGLQAVSGAMSVGIYSVLVYLTQRLLWPLTRLGETLDGYQRAMASTNRIMNLLDVPVTIREGDRPLERGRGEVEFRDVHFAYRGRSATLDGISVRIQAGQTVAVVGPTGSGKSTLVKLLLRFREADAGQVLLDGVPVDQYRLGDLRRNLGLVAQDTFLFAGTVADNIRYGSFGASREEVIAAARAAEADGFIQRLPDGYETVVGERGQQLSGGQQQRIALARAVLKDPPVLVLDEATSAVDNETEAAIQRSLEHITRDRTTLVIAHRLSTVRHADRIYVLDEGRITEAGTHDELLARDGTYANLWRVQTGQHTDYART
jgi:ATP-binding cassette subfamily B protein